MRRVALVSMLLLIVEALPISSANAVEQRFSVFCHLSHFGRMDPIVSPGPGRVSDHDHVFFGNRGTRADSKYREMLSQRTSCDLRADTGAYWVPALVAPDGSAVQPHGAFVYYRTLGALEDERIRAFPKNLRIISDDYHFHCGEDQRSSPLPPDCSDVDGGSMVRLTVLFPSCWDGERKDSVDHRRHMAFQGDRGCPRSHPVALPRLAIIALFEVQDATGYQLSSGDVTTAHGDFWNTWHQPKLRRLTHRCLGRGTSFLCGLISTRD